jgi:transposase
LRRELPTVLRATEDALPTLAHTAVSELHGRLQELGERIANHDRQIAQVAKQSEAAKRLMQVEGVGPITATAMVATVGEANAFPHRRQFARGWASSPNSLVVGASPCWDGLRSLAMSTCARC